VGGNGYAPEGAVRWREADAHPDDHAVLMEFARAAALCNDACCTPEGGLACRGRPDGGRAAGACRQDHRRRRRAVPGWCRDDAIPFDAAHRYMAVLHHDQDGHGRIHVKGAPEAVLALCADQRAADGGSEPLDADLLARDGRGTGRRGPAGDRGRGARGAGRITPALNAADLEGSSR
jgi:magnesium-transporting ATPase (P-type)